MPAKYTTISIPEELHRKIEKIINGTDFVSVGEFTKFLLRSISLGGHIRSNEKSDYATVKKRLKELGYL